jgi:hypothetical protein
MRSKAISKGKAKAGIKWLPAGIVAEVMHIEMAKLHGGMRAREMPLTPLNGADLHIHAPVLGQLPHPGEEADREAARATADLEDAAVACHTAPLDDAIGFPLRRLQKIAIIPKGGLTLPQRGGGSTT